MTDVQTPQVKEISVQAYFRNKGDSKVLIRSHERAAPASKEPKVDGNTRQETS